MLIGSDASEYLVKRFKEQCEAKNQTIIGVETGTLEQLNELVDLVSKKDVSILILP